MDQLHYKSATQLAGLIRRKKIGCLELLDHFLARTEQYNPKLNAIIWMDKDKARKRAKAADSALREGKRYGGVFGHKPTYGLITMRGHALPNAVAPADISVVGPLARSAEDLDLALDIMAGPDPDDGGYLKVALPKCEKTSLRQFRVAVKL